MFMKQPKTNYVHLTAENEAEIQRTIELRIKRRTEIRLAQQNFCDAKLNARKYCQRLVDEKNYCALQIHLRLVK